MDNNLNEGQSVSVPNQEFPTQDVTPVETKSKLKVKKPLIILIISLFIVSIGVLAYIFIKNRNSEKIQLSLNNNNMPTTTKNEPISNESPFGKLTDGSPDNNSSCDNYECLIAAAQNCNPITATISYSELPHPLLDGLVTSGQTIFEIKNTGGGNICTIYISTPIATVNFTEDTKRELIASGSTEEDIASQLETINDSLSSKEVTQSKTVCTANGNVIAEFLSDSEKGNGNIEANMEETVYTTSSGNKLECVTELPPRQKANTTLEITSEECTARMGTPTFVEDSGEGCYVGDTDLGKIVDKNITITPSQQCCVEN